jgi:hypothetical protein
MFTKRNFTISKGRLLTGSLVLFFLLAASDRKTFPDKPADKIDWYNKFFPMEKVFLHTDKYIYKAGETIWFKAYITSFTGERLPLYSNDLYIKLLDQQSGDVIYRRYPIANNMVSGFLVLPRTTMEGKYYLLAYTSWMKNNDPGLIFSKELIVVKNNKRRILADFRLINGETCLSDSLAAILMIRNQTGEPVADAEVAYSIQEVDRNLKQGNSVTDPMGIAQIRNVIPARRGNGACFIKFNISSNQGNGRYVFPLPVSSGDVRILFYTNHGYLLKGQSNRVDMKAVSPFGMPVCCEGEIINQSGKSMMHFKTGIGGMGSLSFQPVDDVYRARIITPPGDSLFLLPPVRESGIYIESKGIKNNAVNFAVSIVPPGSTIKTTWIATVSHKKYWSSEIELTHNSLTEIPLPEDEEGLVQISVFDEKSELLYESLVMVKNRNKILKVAADKKSYGKREKVTVEITSPEKRTAAGNMDLSVSVSQKIHAENGVDKNMDETMTWENRFPTLPYRWVTVDTAAYLQSERPFPVNWADIDRHLNADQERYYNRDGITGIVYDKKKTPVGYAKVKAINIANWKSYETQCDESGVFRVLFGSDIVDFNYLNINAFDASGKVTLWPSIDQDFSNAISNRILVSEQDIIQQKVNDLCKYPFPDMMETFLYQEKKKKSPERETKKISSPRQYVNYSGVLDIIMDLKPLDVINDQIFFKSNPYTYANQPGSLIYIDGVPQGTHISVINNLTPPDIIYINILTTQAEIKHYTSVNYPAVIEIITVRGIAQNRMLPGLSGLDILELNQEFHSPDYGSKGQTKHDVRTTLYWNPDLVVPAGKDKLSLSFYTSDVPGIYLIKIQGFDDSGKPVSAQAEFIVEE